MKTIILRLDRPKDARSSYLQRRKRGGLGAISYRPADKAPYRVEEDLSPKDRRDLERSKEYAVADSFPVSLIRPIKASASTPSAGRPSEPTGTAWGVAAVGADCSPFDGDGVSVALLDTGIDLKHPTFADTALSILTKNFTSHDDHDTDGHGTHCAGTIFGRDVDGQRIGVAPGVKRALIGKVLSGEDLLGETATLVEALFWAVKEGAHVVSLSLSCDFSACVSQFEEAGYQHNAAVSKTLDLYRSNVRLFDSVFPMLKNLRADGGGAVVVAASGNESKRTGSPPYTISASPPAICADVLSVSAVAQTEEGLRVAPFSNTKGKVVAPGVDILSAHAGTTGLGLLSGTSMAVPHVAGVASLFWQRAMRQGEPLTSSHILNRVCGLADTRQLAKGWTPDDVGAGLVWAPE